MKGGSYAHSGCKVLESLGYVQAKEMCKERVLVNFSDPSRPV